ncbi:ZrgA family zinc uptake protein, partial [Klebsiella pneumoniae]
KEKAGHEHEHEHEHENGHADIHAHYQLSCEKPELLKLLTLAEFFKRFPATQKIQVQLIGPDGQKGADLAPASAELKL